VPAYVTVESGPGLRILKKQRTFVAIVDAAFELFSEQGFDATTVEQVAARAEVSNATFFRYFATKDDVVFSSHDNDLPALRQAILQRPRREDDLVALRRAIVRDWVPVLDPHRVARQHVVITSSPRLRGLSLHLGFKWQGVIADALSTRRGSEIPDRRAVLAAGLAMVAFGNAVDSWVREDFRDDLAAQVDYSFQLMADLKGRQ
jgi:AcrR family transcriptional regulator